ncbi:MAG: sialidase family protein [Opitutaceae bacterium]|nr:sialidase family protein [Opitutaceae bacterium]
MNLRSTLTVFLGFALAAAHMVAAPAVSGPPPGVVITASPDSAKIFVSSPTITILPDGTYLVGHDYGGPGAGPRRGNTFIMGSRDRGATWVKLAELPDQKWSTLFLHRAALYLIGTSAKASHMIVRRSSDGGRTWSDPVDAQHGLLGVGKYHCGPTPVVVHGGRVWRAFEHYAPSAPERAFRAFVMSAPEDADLLDARNWTRTNEIAFDKQWLNTRNAEWLEGNIVVAPGGGIVNVLRVESHLAAGADWELPGAARGIPRFEVAAMARISADGRTFAFDPAKDFVHFIGSESKFTIRFDPVSKRYWSLANKITNLRSGAEWVRSPHHQRNVIALTSSADLREWREESRVLRYDEGSVVVKEGSRVGFQYLDWQFDGDDLIAVCRMAWNGANYHDANTITFHRVRGFRSLTMADSPPAVAGGR